MPRDISETDSTHSRNNAEKSNANLTPIATYALAFVKVH